MLSTRRSPAYSSDLVAADPFFASDVSLISPLDRIFDTMPILGNQQALMAAANAASSFPRMDVIETDKSFEVHCE